MLSYILSETAATIFLDKPVTVSRAFFDWDRLIAALKALDEDTVRDCLTEKTLPDSYLSSDIQITHNTVYYHGTPIDNSLTRRMIQMAREGFAIDPMLQFLKNLMENPSNRAINELYTFLGQCNLPITADGCFIAYKNINQDWTDIYTATINNAVGQTVSMPRGLVDDNSDYACSHGLHVCSLSYLPSYPGFRTVAVKVNPKNVVSIPKDHGFTKMRVCEYQVIQELTDVISFDRSTPSVYQLANGIATDELESA